MNRTGMHVSESTGECINYQMTELIYPPTWQAVVCLGRQLLVLPLAALQQAEERLGQHAAGLQRQRPEPRQQQLQEAAQHAMSLQQQARWSYRPTSVCCMHIHAEGEGPSAHLVAPRAVCSTIRWLRKRVLQRAVDLKVWVGHRGGAAVWRPPRCRAVQ